jgi:hypothetical protein
MGPAVNSLATAHTQNHPPGRLHTTQKLHGWARVRFRLVQELVSRVADWPDSKPNA